MLRKLKIIHREHIAKEQMPREWMLKEW